MGRKRGNLSLRDDESRIVIVCEGTETEHPYFKELVRECAISSDMIRIVPEPSDKLTKKSNRPSQPYRKTEDRPYTGKEYYLGLPEKDDATYQKFKTQPKNWVRATELFMEREKYAEGWAVYDLDNKFGGRTLQSHKEARDYAGGIKNLNIAFSAYSFEEWFLLHFERNSTPFHNSDKIDKKAPIGACGVGCSMTNCKGDWKKRSMSTHGKG